MGFLGIGKPRIRDSMLVGITESGKREAGRFSEGNRVLDVLDDRSPQTVGNLRHEVGMSLNEIEDRLVVLTEQGYIRFTGLGD